MAFQDTIQYLYSLQQQGIKFGLANSAVLMERMGNPHLRFPSLHIAGTNGKGSTAAFLDSMLREAGYRVGLYTSPHLVSFTERIRVNGVPVLEDRVVALADRVRERYQGLAATDGEGAFSPTFFEVTTAMAFTHFAEEGIDVAVVETGMGGRLDSTNVITPLVSVVTNIDLEHTEFLGSTLEAVAREKAGIIKQGIPVVTGVVQPDVRALFRSEAERSSSPFYSMPEHFGSSQVLRGQPPRFDYRGIAVRYPGLSLGLLGAHQVANACLAIAAVELVGAAGFPVPEKAVRSGLAAAVWPGRLERVAVSPDIYIDGAHNPASASVLAEALKEMKGSYRRVIMVLGVLRDKDHRGIIEQLVPLADQVVVTKPDYVRALDVSSLDGEVARLSPDRLRMEGLEAAIAKARTIARQDDLIVITGSLYTVGEARSLLVPSGSAGSLGELKG